MCVVLWGNVYVTGSVLMNTYVFAMVIYNLVTDTHGWDVSGLCDYVIHSAIDGWFCAASFCNFCGSAVRDIVMMTRSLLRC